MWELPKPLKIISDWIRGIQAAQWIYAIIVGGVVTVGVNALSAAPLYALLLLFIGTMLGILAGVLAWQNYRHDLTDTERAKAQIIERERHDVHLPSGYLSLKEAASRLYKESSRQFILKRAQERRERLGDAEITRSTELQRVAKYIASKIPVSGKHGSSGAFRKIETHELEASNFDEQATILRHTFYPDPPSFTGLGVREDELNALIADEQVDEGYEGAKS